MKVVPGVLVVRCCVDYVVVLASATAVVVVVASAVVGCLPAVIVHVTATGVMRTPLCFSYCC